jgi:hypothetical protein
MAHDSKPPGYDNEYSKAKEFLKDTVVISDESDAYKSHPSKKEKTEILRALKE